MSQIQVLQWLIANRDLLTKAIEVAKQFSRHKPYMEQWSVIDQLARLLIPVLLKGDVSPKAFGMVNDDSSLRHYGPDYDAKMLALGAEVGAMGVDWKAVIEVLLPVIMAILDALSKIKSA